MLYRFTAKDSLCFWIELVYLLLEQVVPKIVVVRLIKKPDMLFCMQVCVSQDTVSNIADLKTGRYHYCQIKHKEATVLHHISMYSVFCSICKTSCFAEFHRH